MYACCASPTTATWCCCCFCVPQGTIGVVDKCGKYEGLAAPGIHFTDPCCVRVSGVVTLRVQNMTLQVQSKTQENVFVTMHMEVQYQVLPGAIDVAYYYLENPKICIESYVSANVRASVPLFTLDELYLERNTIAARIKNNVDAKMDEFGFDILAVLITDIRPDIGVRSVMDQLLASKRLQLAAHDAAAAECILKVKNAEAAAELARLSAVGVANQRREVLKGLEFSVEAMREVLPKYNTDELLHILLTNQYLDVIKEVSAQGTRGAIEARRENQKHGVSSPDDDLIALSPKLTLISSAMETATESMRNSAEAELAELENKYAQSYGMKEFTTTREGILKLREMYNQKVALEARIAELDRMVAVDKKKDEAYNLSNTHQNGGGPGGKGKKGHHHSSNKNAGNPFSVNPTGSLRRHPKISTLDALYMPHISGLKGLASQLVRTAAESVPQEARDRAAYMMMQGKRLEGALSNERMQ